MLPLTPSPLLFQQVKSIERFLRRLEFHASKVSAGAVLGWPCCPQPCTSLQLRPVLADR